MHRFRSIPRIAIAVSLACAVPLALAQTTPPQQPPPQHPQSGAITHSPPMQQSRPLQSSAPQPQPASIPKADPSSNIKGQHDLAATVESVGQNGVVAVQTGLGDLKVQFPGAGQNLKKGDKIILHLSYSVDESGAPSSAPASSK
ncbi:MAG: hypothetical protein EPN36_08685 [Rhodanobacteraceae bacterium]|nr:MAG: hypothetical protein EPN36_08685 [Rhodanobacteraceae bacterium]